MAAFGGKASVAMFGLGGLRRGAGRAGSAMRGLRQGMQNTRNFGLGGHAATLRTATGNMLNRGRQAMGGKMGRGLIAGGAGLGAFAAGIGMGRYSKKRSMMRGIHPKGAMGPFR
jgi:hypothetical protein